MSRRGRGDHRRVQHGPPDPADRAAEQQASPACRLVLGLVGLPGTSRTVPSGTGSSSSREAMYPCTVARSANPAAAASSANRGLASRNSVSETASSPISRKYAASASDQPTKAGSVRRTAKPHTATAAGAAGRRSCRPGEQAGADVAPSRPSPTPQPPTATAVKARTPSGAHRSSAYGGAERQQPERRHPGRPPQRLDPVRHHADEQSDDEQPGGQPRRGPPLAEQLTAGGADRGEQQTDERGARGVDRRSAAPRRQQPPWPARAPARGRSTTAATTSRWASSADRSRSGPTSVSQARPVSSCPRVSRVAVASAQAAAATAANVPVRQTVKPPAWSSARGYPEQHPDRRVADEHLQAPNIFRGRERHARTAGRRRRQPGDHRNQDDCAAARSAAGRERRERRMPAAATGVRADRPVATTAVMSPPGRSSRGRSPPGTARGPATRARSAVARRPSAGPGGPPSRSVISSATPGRRPERRAGRSAPSRQAAGR